MNISDIELDFGRDVQGLNAFAPQISNNMFSAELKSGGNDSITVPSTSADWIAVFSYEPGAAVWTALNTTAAPPAGSTFVATHSFLLPAQFSVKAADTISMYNNSSTAQDVGIALYAVA